MEATTSGSYPIVTADGVGVVSHAGTALLAEVADRVGLCASPRIVEAPSLSVGLLGWGKVSVRVGGLDLLGDFCDGDRVLAAGAGSSWA